MTVGGKKKKSTKEAWAAPSPSSSPELSAAEMDFWALKGEASGSPYRPAWSLLDDVGLSGTEEGGGQTRSNSNGSLCLPKVGAALCTPVGCV